MGEILASQKGCKNARGVGGEPALDTHSIERLTGNIAPYRTLEDPANPFLWPHFVDSSRSTETSTLKFPGVLSTYIRK